jgi:hypothetical protein
MACLVLAMPCQNLLAAEENGVKPADNFKKPKFDKNLLAQISKIVEKYASYPSEDAVSEAAAEIKKVGTGPVLYLTHLFLESDSFNRDAFLLELLFSSPFRHETLEKILEIIDRSSPNKKALILEREDIAYSSEETKRIIHLLTHDNAHVRFCASQLLSRLKDKYLWLSTEIEKLLEQDNVSMAAKKDILYSLGKLGDRNAFLKIMEMVDSDNEQLCKAAIKALARFKTNDALEKLGKLLAEDNNPKIRKLAVKGLQKIGGKEVIPWLIKALDDSNAHVRKRANISLKNLTKKNLGENAALWWIWWKDEGSVIASGAFGSSESFDEPVSTAGVEEAAKDTSARKTAKAPVEKKESGSKLPMIIGIILAVVALILIIKFLFARPAQAVAKAAAKADPKKHPRPKIKEIQEFPDI